MRKTNQRIIIVTLNVIVGVCTFVLGKEVAIKLVKREVSSHAYPESPTEAASRAILARAFAFDNDIAAGYFGSAETGIFKESIGQNLQSALFQYGVLSKHKSSNFLKRYISIKGGTAEQTKAYRHLFIDREQSISRKQKIGISQKIRELLGSAQGEYGATLVWLPLN